jgi:hypothetical protein
MCGTSVLIEKRTQISRWIILSSVVEAVALPEIVSVIEIVMKGMNVDHLVVILTVTGIRIAIAIVPKEIVTPIADEHTVIAEKRSQNGFQVVQHRNMIQLNSEVLKTFLRNK